MTTDSEEVVVSIRDVESQTPEHSTQAHEPTGDDHGQSDRAAEDLDHGDEGEDVENGAIVCEESYQLMRPPIHDNSCVIYRTPGIPYCI